MAHKNHTFPPLLVLSNATRSVNPSTRNRLKLLQIEVYVGATVVLLAFLVLFGSFRRRSHNKALQISLWVAYILSTYLITYTIGLMQWAPFHNELFAVWAAFLVLVFGNIDTISAYSLEDNENYKRYIWELYGQLFWMGFLIGTYDSETKFKALLFVLWILTSFKTVERAQALQWASRSRGLMINNKLISDYMVYEHTLIPQADDHDIDSVKSMQGYNYLVTGDQKQEGLQVVPPLYLKQLDITKEATITVHKIWECKGTLLSSTNDPDNQLKDIFLSYALYRLLRRRFAGFSLAESCLEKTWNFVRYGLLSDEEGSDDPDYERAFRVIETELAFLYDSFYTKYPVIFADGIPKFRFLSLLLVIFGCTIAALTLHRYQQPDEYVSLLTVSGRSVDVLVTGLVIIAILFMELVQFFLVYFSDWAKVLLICEYVAKPSWRTRAYVETIVETICRKQIWFKPWERKLGQYSLIKSFNRNPVSILLSYNCWTASYVTRERKGKKESSRIKLTTEVKKAITLSFKTNGKQLSNGVASLQRNGFANQFSWACGLETQTHVILVWHIATSLCEMSPNINPVDQRTSTTKEINENFNVATALSEYCTYLVAFKPRLLPDHAYTTEFIFDQVVNEAREALQGCKTLESKYEKMLRLGAQGDTSSADEKKIVNRGAVLGRKLMEEMQERQELWKVLAEFWAEMMLFVAPSDDATAHAQNLATGGEFVTHLWALLTHAGVLQRPGSVV